jgi:hypothetical protein
VGTGLMHYGPYSAMAGVYDALGAVPLNTLGRMFGYNPGFSGTKFMDKLTEGEYSKRTGYDPDKAWFGLPTSAKKGFTLPSMQAKEEKVDEVIDDKWSEKFLGDGKEEVEEIKETASINLTPSEKEGLKASMMMGAGTGALSAKGDVIDVLKGALLGAGKEGLKGVDPATEKKYRIWGEAQAKRDIEKLKKADEIATSPKNLYTKLLVSGASPSSSMSVAHQGTKIKNIPKENPKVKDSKEIRNKALLELEEGDVYYDEEKGWMLKGPGDETKKISSKQAHSILIKRA